jgi:hypothetical protein
MPHRECIRDGLRESIVSTVTADLESIAALEVCSREIVTAANLDLETSEIETALEDLLAAVTTARNAGKKLGTAIATFRGIFFGRGLQGRMLTAIADALLISSRSVYRLLELARMRSSEDGTRKRARASPAKYALGKYPYSPTGGWARATRRRAGPSPNALAPGYML